MENKSKTMENDEYMKILAGCTRSIFQDCESFLRTEVHLIEDDIRLVLDKYNSCFIASEITSGIYTFKDHSELLLRNSQLGFDGFNNSANNEFNDISMRSKMIVTPDIIALWFDEKSFSVVSYVSTLIGILDTIMNIIVR